LASDDLPVSGLQYADAHGAGWAGLRAPGTLWEHVGLAGVDLTGADLRGAMFRHCCLDGALLDRADLTDARLVMCSFDGATLRGAVLADAITIGCTFAGADVAGARGYAACRDLVVEMLRRSIGDDLEAIEVVGAVAVQRKWCYAEWWELLADRPRLRQLGLEIFATMPGSGCLEEFHRPD